MRRLKVATAMSSYFEE